MAKTWRVWNCQTENVVFSATHKEVLKVMGYQQWQVLDMFCFQTSLMKKQTFWYGSVLVPVWTHPKYTQRGIRTDVAPKRPASEMFRFPVFA